MTPSRITVAGVWVAQMVVCLYSPVPSDLSPSGEAPSVGGSVFPEVCVSPVEVPSQRPGTVLEDGSARWFGAGGLAVRPPPHADGLRFRPGRSRHSPTQQRGEP